MASDSPGALERIRQPQYTGENRCLPCTGVNLVIAVVLAGIVAVVSPPLAVAVFLVSIGAIYVRGYLVPGTPSLTKRYVPDWVLAKFDKGPARPTGIDRPQGTALGGDGTELEREGDWHRSASARSGDTTLEAGSVTDESAAAEERAVANEESVGETDESVGEDARATTPSPAADPETTFLEYGLVEPCADRDDLCLDTDLGERWRRQIETIRDGNRTEQVATYLGADPTDVSLTVDTDRAVVRIDDRLAAWWESDAALVADLASDEVLTDVIDGWDEWSLQDRSQLAGGLRAFVEACPTCDGPVSLGEETVESCCRSREIFAVSCEDCGVHILELDAIE